MKSKSNTQQINDDFAPVSGGRGQADSYRRDDVDDLASVKADSQLDRHIVRLLALHKKLRVRFKNQDLSQFSDDAKRVLLADMNDLLGIKS
ncbi:hypothetical protein LF1_07060 [Rubripirellula obstinata]|uniref:Uncharacterized protein n=1 Tax=Rubripirellula obstinata TaxID=406547 RepID=A0A5B1CF28_9BACT|nr:hypothetical protein [Rubripirellula obstinata]KAA1258190.1 hypothetical protein LF1_07060 [Rubripirellula obstinata]